MTLTSATFFGTPSLKPDNENKANIRWGTTDEQLLHHPHRKKPTRRGENKPQTATLISMHVLRFAQLHSDWSLHNKPVRMKQNCSRKVRETPLLPPLKKEKNGKLKQHILPFSGSADHIRVHSSHSGSFQYISVHSGSILVHSLSFRCHSALFRYIPAHSGIFRARSIQPKFTEISVQNSMDQFGPTGKVSKKLVHLLRWSSFRGRTGWNVG